jgi:hypothetical protein
VKIIKNIKVMVSAGEDTLIQIGFFNRVINIGITIDELSKWFSNNPKTLLSGYFCLIMRERGSAATISPKCSASSTPIICFLGLFNLTQRTNK